MGDENAEIIPGTRRPDGTYRKDVRKKKGYTPPEEMQKFRPVDTTPVGVIGADPIESAKPKPTTQAAKKNEKRKEKKKAAESGQGESAAAVAPAAAPGGVTASAPAVASAATAERAAEVSEVERKIKALKKKLRQIDELEEKKAAGATLNAEQTAKIEARADIDAEIAKWESLGEMDVSKKVKALKKKLRQIEELEEKKASGVELNPDQEGKVQAKAELLDEIKLLESLVIS